MKMLAIKTKSQRYHVWVTFLFVYTILASVALYKGSVQSLDTATYMQWADLLIGHQFNLVSYYRDNPFTHPVFYTLPVSVFAILRLTMNDQWVLGFQVANLVALLFSLFLYIKISLHLRIRKWLVSFSLLAFLYSQVFSQTVAYLTLPFLRLSSHCR